MNFELWLYTIKRLAQTMDAAKLIFDGLSPDAQEELRKEYEAYVGAAPGSDKGKEESETRDNNDMDQKTLALITVVAIMSTGITDNSLRSQIANAKNSGITQKEITAAINHSAYYIGWPKAWAALSIVKEIYEAGR